MGQRTIPAGEDRLVFSAWHCPAGSSVNSKTDFSQATDFLPITFKGRRQQDTNYQDFIPTSRKHNSQGDDLSLGNFFFSIIKDFPVFLRTSSLYSLTSEI